MKKIGQWLRDLWRTFWDDAFTVVDSFFQWMGI